MGLGVRTAVPCPPRPPDAIAVAAGEPASESEAGAAGMATNVTGAGTVGDVSPATAGAGVIAANAAASESEW